MKNLQPVTVVKVSYCQGRDLIPMGQLAYKDREIFFEYSAGFLQLGIDLSPFMLPLKPGVFNCKDRTFEGLFGIFNDSLPDGWGRLLLDRKLTKTGLNSSALTPLDRLSYVGNRGLGALIYEPAFNEETTQLKITDLDRIAAECLQYQQQESDEFVEDLLAMNGSSAGARPKLLVSLTDNNKFQLSDNTLGISHNDWIIKFRSSYDPKDIGPIEYAYHLMAKAAGVEVPEAQLFKSRAGGGHFAVKRFDRQGTVFLHMHSLSGLIHADHRTPSLDYQTLMKVTQYLTKDIQESAKQFLHMTFNVFAHNRDDHAKNFAFLLDEKAQWRVSPAYDVVFSSGPAGEHCMTVMGEGKNPGIKQLLQLAQIVGIQRQKALAMIEQVQDTVSNWRLFADEAQVSASSCITISKALRV